MSDSTTPSEIWNNILKDNVGKDDPLWKEYLDKAAVFDVRMVDEWNKIIDVLLFYVALFISVLTSFIIQSWTQFQPDPSDITNNLLVAIYNQLVAQSNNTSIPRVDTESYFNQSKIQSKIELDAAVNQNTLLYTSLALSIIVSVIALVAKLWLVSYSRQAFSVGSRYDRAMKRQEAYNGVLVWNLGGVINMLPVVLLIALYLFGIYVYTSLDSILESFILNNNQTMAFDGFMTVDNTGIVTEGLLAVGMMFLGFTSLGGAFVPGCPFRSAFSGVIRLIFEILQKLIERITCGCFSSKRLRWLWIGTLALLGVAADAALVYVTVKSRTWSSLFFFPAAIPISYSAQRKAVHKPQKYKISCLSAWMFFFVSLSMSLALWFTPLLYFTEVLGIIIACWMFSKMSKSMADTGEIDAIAWLLITAPPQHPATFFKKAGQMIGLDSIGRHYRPRLLESLMPLLTHLITSCHTPQHHASDSDTHSPSSEPRRNFKIELKREQSDHVLDGQYRRPTSLSLVEDDMGPIDEDPHLKNLEIYVACLARLSEFTDYGGSFWCLREDAMQHPKLGQQLIDKLVVFANPRHHFQDSLRSAASKVLSNYELDMQGNPVKNPVNATASWSISTVLSTTTLILNINGRNDHDPEQGDSGSNLHRPVDPDTRVEPAHSSGEIKEVKIEIGDAEMR